MSCSVGFESNFGPVVSPCRRSFDFTLLFEESILLLLPSCILILIASIRVFWLARRRTIVGYKGLFALKAFLLTAFLALETSRLALVCTTTTPRTRASIPAASLCLVAAAAVAVLSYFEHTKTFRSSLLIGFYLTLTSILRAATVRTYWLLEPHGSLASVVLASLLVQLVLLFVESLSKKRCILDPKQEISPEETAGFLSQCLYAWLNPLLFLGNRASFVASDLSPIDPALVSRELTCKFRRLQLVEQGKKYAALRGTLVCLGFDVFLPIFPRLCLTAFNFCQPFISSAMIAYLDDLSSSANTGYGLIGACFLTYMGIAVSTNWYWHLSYRYVTMARGGLVDAVMQKALRLPYEKGSESKGVTLMISDVQRIVSALAWLHELWASPLETAIGTWLLWRQVGPSSLIVLAIALICTALSTVVSKKIGPQQQVWLAATEKRIAGTKKMLSSIKAIKMMNASPIVGAGIEALRQLEFGASKMFRTLIIGSLFSSYATLTLAPVLVFGVYIATSLASGGQLDAEKLFSSLILVSLISNPLVHILQVLPSFGAALGCFERIDNYLGKDDLGACESRGPAPHDDPPANISEKEKFSAKQADVTDDSLIEKRAIVALHNASVGWDPEKPLVKNVSLDIQPGQHVVIRGSVGCGKTLLLQSMLGEVKPIQGSIQVEARTVAYCSQTPWLENLTAKENAFRFSRADDIWQQRVTDACDLKGFINAQPEGETIGSGGARLSGGERQRLALARAISSNAPLILLDDVFSAMDLTTKHQITYHLFGPTGIVQSSGATVIQTTNDPVAARYADIILDLDENGHLKEASITPQEHPCDRSQFQDGNLELDAVLEPAVMPEPTKEDVVEHRPQAEDQKKQKPPAAFAAFADPTKVSDRQVYQSYFGSIGPQHLVIFAICGIIFAFTLRFPDVWVMWWSEANENGSASPGRNAYFMGIYALLNVLPLISVCVWVGTIVLTIPSFLMLKIVPKSGVALHQRLLDTVLGSTFSFISRIDTGSIINRFNQDLMLVDSSLPLMLLNTVALLLEIIIQVVLVAVSVLWVLLVVPVIGMVMFFVQRFYLRTSKQLRQLDLESKAAVQTKFLEFSEGLTTIRAFGWQAMSQAEFRDKLDRSQEPFYLLYMVQTWLKLVMNMQVAGVAVVVVGIAVALRHETSGSKIGVSFLNIVTLGENLTNLITSWTGLETSLGAIARIKAFENDTPKEAESLSPTEPPASWPNTGHIGFDRVSVSYSEDEGILGLRDLSIDIKPGEKIAVCGRSGSGKSTLLLSLLGLVKVTQGKINLDGVDISCIKQSLLRSRFIVISQDAYVQDDADVRTALGVPSDVGKPDSEVLNTLEVCGLSEKIKQAGGLAASFKDVNLSAGETQLFVFARALLQLEGAPRGASILFDEAASSMDLAAEKKIFRILREKFQDRTSISVLHRLEAAMEYDRILVLDKGRVAHFDTPDNISKVAELFANIVE